MDESIDRNRRRFLRGAAMTLAAVEFGILGRLRAEALAEAGTAIAREAQSRQLGALGRATNWLNSPPLSTATLSGKVVLVQFGTYTCINWLRITTTPREARGWASGASMTSFGAGSVPVTGMTWGGLQACVGFCAWMVVPSCISPATNNTAVTFPAACFSVIMIVAPLIQAAFDMPDHTGRR